MDEIEEIELLQSNNDDDVIIGNSFTGLDNFDEMFNEWEEEEENKEINMATLNFERISKNLKGVLWRSGPAPLNEIESLPNKIATLKGPYKTDLSDLSALLEKSTNESERNATASAGLLSYFAHLGTADANTKADSSFLEILLQSADIDTRDIHGQTIFHEVAREWRVDLAYYLKRKGANIDLADNLGRTPLIVASASNHTDMIVWLLNNGANLKHRTMKGEGQSAIHYAAKYDALDAIKILIARGADPIERDDRKRTPLFLAAEQGLPNMVEYMLALGLPTASYNDGGVSAIDHILSKSPAEIASTALDQFIVHDKAFRRRKSYISCLEKWRWRLLTNSYECHTNYSPPTPLELIVHQNDLDLINHPVILELIELKRQFYGFKFKSINIFLCVLFTFVWTIAVTIHDKGEDIAGNSMKAVLFFTAFGQLLTFIFMVKLGVDYYSHTQSITNTKKERIREIEFERQFCHPRWRVEEKLLNKNLDVIKRFSRNYWADGWNVIEALCLLMAIVETILTIIRAVGNLNNITAIRHYYSAIFVLVVWLRLNRCLRVIGSLGPFIAMLGECVIATTRFAFLFFEFFIPFSIAFWVLFGGNRKNSNDGEYETFNDMLYQLYLLTIVGDYDYDTLKNIDKITAQILVGLYFILVSVISLNLFIALLSEAVARVNQTASATAYMKEAEELINIERQFPEVKRNFDIYVNTHCAPKITPMLVHLSQKELNPREIISKLLKSIKDTSSYLQTISQSQIQTKKTLDDAEEKIKSFSQKHDDENIELLWQRFQDVYDFHVTKLNKIHRITRNRFQRLFTKDDEGF